MQEEAAAKARHVDARVANDDAILTDDVVRFEAVTLRVDVQEVHHQENDDQNLEDKGENTLENDAIKLLSVGRSQESLEADAVDVFVELDVDLIVVDFILRQDVFFRRFLTFFL